MALIIWPNEEATWDNLDVEESFFLRMAITFYAENQVPLPIRCPTFEHNVNMS